MIILKIVGCVILVIGFQLSGMAIGLHNSRVRKEDRMPWKERIIFGLISIPLLLLGYYLLAILGKK